MMWRIVWRRVPISGTSYGAWRECHSRFPAVGRRPFQTANSGSAPLGCYGAGLSSISSALPVAQIQAIQPVQPKKSRRPDSNDSRSSTRTHLLGKSHCESSERSNGMAETIRDNRSFGAPSVESGTGEKRGALGADLHRRP